MSFQFDCQTKNINKSKIAVYWKRQTSCAFAFLLVPAPKITDAQRNPVLSSRDTSKVARFGQMFLRQWHLKSMRHDSNSFDAKQQLPWFTYDTLKRWQIFFKVLLVIVMPKPYVQPVFILTLYIYCHAVSLFCTWLSIYLLRGKEIFGFQNTFLDLRDWRCNRVDCFYWK